MEASGQIHVPAALTPGETVPSSNGQEAGLDSEPVWTLWSWSSFAPCQESNSGRPARAVPTELSRLSANELQSAFLEADSRIELGVSSENVSETSSC
jgi:hypothetical protein